MIKENNTSKATMELEKKKVPELKKMAKGLGIKVSKLKKTDLIEAIKQAQNLGKEEQKVSSSARKKEVPKDTSPKNVKGGNGDVNLTDVQKRMKELNPSLFEKVVKDLDTIPDVRPFAATTVMPTAWNPWDELVFEYEAFATRASVFGSIEASFLAYVDRGIYYGYVPSSVSPYAKPEEFIKQKKEVYADINASDVSELYGSYPLVMWIYLADNPQLGRKLRGNAEMLYIASCMGKTHPYSIIDAMKHIKPWGANVSVIELKMEISGEIGYFPWEDVDPIHEKIAKVIFKGKIQIKRYDSMASFSKTNREKMGAPTDRLITEYLNDPAIINNRPLYIELANEMEHPDTHMGAYRYTAPIGIEPLRSRFNKGWNTDAAIFFLTDPVVNSGQIESDEMRSAVFRVLVGEPIAEDEIKRFILLLEKKNPSAVTNLITSRIGTTPKRTGTFGGLKYGSRDHTPDNIITIFTALLEIRTAIELKGVFEDIIRAFEHFKYEPNALKTIILWDKLKADLVSPAFFETVMLNLQKGDFETAMKLPLMKEKKVISVINKGFGKSRKASTLLKLLYKIATRSIREERWETAHSQLQELVPLFSEIPETHLWILMLRPSFPSSDAYGRNPVNPLVEEAFQRLGASAVLDIYIQLEVLEGIELAFKKGATTSTIDPLMLPGKLPEVIMYLKMKQDAGK